jgi:uncharacterized protein (TIGR04255 family)
LNGTLYIELIEYERMANHQYDNPPVEEALCEFHFLPSEEWDLMLPALFREKIKTAYPGKARQQNLVAAELGYSPQLNEPGITLKQGLTKYLFPSSDEKKMIGLAPDILSIHVLRPYDGWVDFQQRIKESLAAYVEVTKDSNVRRISMRYINKIEIPVPTIGQAVDLDIYFTSSPKIPANLPQNLSSFIVRNEFLYEEEYPIRMMFTLSDLKIPDPNFVALLLDIEAVQEWENPIGVEEALESLEILKAKQSKVFESLITDDTRRLFDATA